MNRLLMRALVILITLSHCLFLNPLKTPAQNYIITFAATGSVTTLDSVKAENLTQGTSITLAGDDSLHLKGTINIREPYAAMERMTIFPNPMRGEAELSYYTDEPGILSISIYDITGKMVLSSENDMVSGINSYRLSGLRQGLFIVRISINGRTQTAKLVSVNTSADMPQIGSGNSSNLPESFSGRLPGAKSIIDMAYTTGDTMRFTGYSGPDSSVVADVPASDKTITFLFKTLPGVTTSPVTAITHVSAISGGNVISDGGDSVTARGVCWSTSPNPTTTDSITINGAGTGMFTSNLTGLTPTTTYYVRAYATNSIGTSYGMQDTFTTSAVAPVVQIGDSYGGGIVAYILQPGDPGYDPNVQHGLIAAPTDQNAGIQWHNGVSITTGATGTALGQGPVNTATIVSVQGTGSYAAQLCNDLMTGNYSDWYLPSKDELNKLFISKNIIGGFVSLLYWASTEVTTTDAAIQSFSSGNQLSYGKNNPTAVRCMRSF